MRGLALLLAAFFVLPHAAWAQAPSRATHAATAQQFQKWIDEAAQDNFRPVSLAAYNDGASPRFAATAVENKAKVEWRVKSQLDAAGFQKAEGELVKEGFRLTQLAGYLEGKEVRLAGLFVKDGENRAWQARRGLSSAEFQKAFDEQVAAGRRPTQVVGYADGKGGHVLAGIFLADEKAIWLARHDQTEAQYQKTVTDSAPQGYRPASLSVYPTPNGPRFAAVLVKDNAEWKARQGLTSAGYQQLWGEYQGAGFRLLTVTGYATADGLRYAALWVKEPKSRKGPPPAELPTTGAAVPELAVLEAAMQGYLRERSIACGTLAVSKNGKLVFARGYGYADREQKRLITADDPFRLASVSKPITKAAIRKLIGEKKLTFQTKVLPLLALDPPPDFDPEKRDARLDEITVLHLLTHQGGFDREKSFDPMFRTQQVAKGLKIKGPPSPLEVSRYMLGRPLDFAPGSRTAYSNIGFCLLGQVVAKVSGKSYLDYVREEIMQPLGATSFELGRSLPKDRNPREPYYDDPDLGPNVFDPTGPLVPFADGAVYIEGMDAHGGWIGSAVDLVKFLDAYHVGGGRRGEERMVDGMFGSLPGTFTMIRERRDGVNLAVLFNQRQDESGKDYTAIEKVLDDACDQVSIWPRGK